MPSTCTTCTAYANTNVPLAIVDATFSPSVVSVLTDSFNLMDGATSYTSGNSPRGAQASAANSNFIQVQLDAAYSDIDYMRVWGGLTTGVQQSAFITVYLSPGPNATAGAACISGLSLLPGFEYAITCTHIDAPNTAYVTISKSDASSSQPLVIHELYIYRSSEWAPGTRACSMPQA